MIEFAGVSFAYGERSVFDGASFALDAGSLHFLTGRSGAGKTTLLRLAHLALAPDLGAVRLFGEDSSALDRRARARMRRRLGLVTQDCALVEHLTVGENLALPLRIAGERPEDRANDVAEVAEWVGLADRMAARPPELSSGERRRVEVARAVIGAPEAVIADEPTGDVDAEAAERILNLFLELHRSGRTVLVATHDLGLIRRAQGRAKARTLRLEDGRVIRAGAPL